MTLVMTVVGAWKVVNVVVAVVYHMEGLHHDGPEPDTDVGGAHVDQTKPRQLLVAVDAHLTRDKGDNSGSGNRCFEYHLALSRNSLRPHG